MVVRKARETIKGRVSPKGQVTLPSEVRRFLGVGPGDEVAFVIKDDEVTVKRSPDMLRKYFQSVPALPRKLTLSQMTEIAAEEAAIEANL